jgi:hypothetical protein
MPALVPAIKVAVFMMAFPIVSHYPILVVSTISSSSFFASHFLYSAIIVIPTELWFGRRGVSRNIPLMPTFVRVMTVVIVE